MKFVQLCLFVSALAVGSVSYAGKLTAETGWVRAVPPVSKNTAAYFTINNQSKKDEMLLHIESDAAKHTELHMIVEEPNGAKRMQKMPHASIKAGETLSLTPGGYHVMLIDLVKPLKEGDSVTVDMVFQHAGKLSVRLPVTMPSEKKQGKQSGGHHHHHH